MVEAVRATTPECRIVWSDPHRREPVIVVRLAIREAIVGHKNAKPTPAVNTLTNDQD